MKNFLVIADIAGEMDALERLTALVPKKTVKISVGDMCDRGPRSREVFDYFQKGYGKDKFAIMGNHCHMMLFFYGIVSKNYRIYEPMCWLWNGGGATNDSYGGERVSPATLDWVSQLPISMELEGGSKKLFISHAPWYSAYEYECRREDLKDSEVMDIVWNRWEPNPRVGYLQIFGHNSHWGLRSFKEPGQTEPYALCIDQSRSKKLTGYLYPEGQILEVPYSTEPPKDVNSPDWEGEDDR